LQPRITCVPRDYYNFDTNIVAKGLLGRMLVRVLRSSVGPIRLAGIITETEAYGGYEDPASHAFRGLTPRNSIMFGQRGFCYVYLIYGMYHCLNVVAYANKKVAGAVLIRSIYPIEGIKTMKIFRKSSRFKDLTNGPGKICIALMIDRTLNGIDFTDSQSCLRIEDGIKAYRIKANKRVGITFGTELNWRYLMVGDIDYPT